MSSVLVVDDEPAMREFYTRALLAGGHHAIDVRTAEEALVQLSIAGQIGVVIADLSMPGHGGEWLVGQMRSRFPNVAVILATANDSVAGAVSLQPTVTSYLVKPIEARRLLDAVAAAMAWHEHQQRSNRNAEGGAIENWLDRKLTHQPPDADAQ